MWATWLWRYAPHAVVAAGLGILCIYAVYTFREQGRAELRPQIERLETALAEERADRARAERASGSYQLEIERLRKRTLDRAINRPVVRLCNNVPATSDGDAALRTTGSSATTGSDERTTGANPTPGPDIGADLYALAAACDAENAKLRALQGWVKDGG